MNRSMFRRRGGVTSFGRARSVVIRHYVQMIRKWLRKSLLVHSKGTMMKSPIAALSHVQKCTTGILRKREWEVTGRFRRRKIRDIRDTTGHQQSQELQFLLLLLMAPVPVPLGPPSLLILLQDLPCALQQSLTTAFRNRALCGHRLRSRRSMNRSAPVLLESTIQLRVQANVRAAFPLLLLLRRQVHVHLRLLLLLLPNYLRVYGIPHPRRKPSD
mmetsp:Transcript_41486/g.69144  ORF Transcript_41486/g.69144 Transcript_41486/m.69144 type:complete len:215 (+) Transcript_41486:625-1269(+)